MKRLLFIVSLIFLLSFRVLTGSEAATTELSLGDTHKYNLIPVGDILKVPEGATGCTIHDDGIRGTLDLDEQVGGDTLGLTLVINGTFDVNIVSWINKVGFLYDTFEWDVTEKIHLVSDGTSTSYGSSGDDISVVVGHLYKLTYDYAVAAGAISAIRLRQALGVGTAYLNETNISGTDSYVGYFTAKLTEDIQFIFLNNIGTAVNSTLDNIAVQEVTSDTGIYNTWITTVDLAGITIDEVAIFRNCAFVQSEATITATLPTASLEDEAGATEMRGSFIDGQAWFHDAGGLIAAFAGTGNLIIANDGSGNLAQGYLGEVGTGETGDEIITDATNRDFSGAGDWIAGGAATVTVNYNSGDGGHATTMRVEAGDATLESASLPNTTGYGLTDGKLYKLSFDYKDIESTNITPFNRVRILTTGGGQYQYDLAVSAVWATKTVYFTSEGSGNISVMLYTNRNAGHADNETLFDSVTVKEVTEPNANAVHIYKEHALTNEGWYSIDAGSIGYNAGASWDFDIYNYGTVWFDDECQFSINTTDCFRDYAGADYHLTAGSPLKDAGEDYLNIVNLDTSDFSAGVDDYGSARMHTFTGDHDAVNDGVTSKDNCLMAAADAQNAAHPVSIVKANSGMSDQADFKLTYSFYVPAGQNHTDGMQVMFFDGSDTLILTSHTGITGAWTTDTVYFSAPETATMILYLYMMDGMRIFCLLF